MSRAQITKERNTECWQFRKCFFSEIHHPHLKYLGITISQTLMATNSPLFSMMLTVTWDDAHFKIVIVKNGKYFYLPPWCGSVTHTSWVFQPLVHHCLSLFSIFLKPVVVPVLLTWRPLTYGGFIKYCFLLDLLNSDLLHSDLLNLAPVVIFQTLSPQPEQCPIGLSPFSHW